MNYLFIPDTFNYNLATQKFPNNEKFLECQIKYKKKFEEFLCKYINFQEVQDYIEKHDIDLPRIKDEDYNFYHKYSNIGSSYIYIRNNYHVENLTNEEIQQILNNEKLDDTFFFNTFKKVIFETGNSTFFGEPMNETEVNSKSIVFEFAYNQLECQSVEQLNKIKKLIENCFGIIKQRVIENLNIKCSFLVYNGIPDIFYENVETKIRL